MKILSFLFTLPQSTIPGPCDFNVSKIGDVVNACDLDEGALSLWRASRTRRLWRPTDSRLVPPSRTGRHEETGAGLRLAGLLAVAEGVALAVLAGGLAFGVGTAGETDAGLFLAEFGAARKAAAVRLGFAGEQLG